MHMDCMMHYDVRYKNMMTQQVVAMGLINYNVTERVYDLNRLK